MDSAPLFLFATCQQGAEAPLKQELAQQGWRLAFSRPGFVSCKWSGEAAGAEAPSVAPAQFPGAAFARHFSWSIGRSTASDTSTLAREIVELLAPASGASEAVSGSLGPIGLPFDQLHVWSRDRMVVGERGYQPRLEPLTDAVAEELLPILRDAGIVKCSTANLNLELGQRALDLVLTDPSQWMIGWHSGEKPVCTRWAGAFPPLDWDHDVVSRAYFKAAEAILWSGMPMKPGETVVEVGSAPGGAAQRMLELGFKVIGVDPAEMDPEIMEHPNFRHLKARGGDVKRSEYRDARWLFVDSNVRPDKTLVTVENIVTNRQVDIRGLILTMKIGRYDQADRILGWCRTIRQWGYRKVKVRQLATGKCEVCIAAMKN